MCFNTREYIGLESRRILSDSRHSRPFTAALFGAVAIGARATACGEFIECFIALSGHIMRIESWSCVCVRALLP